jgi:hypothetical protein
MTTADRQQQLAARHEIRLAVDRALAQGFTKDDAEQIFACVREYFHGEERVEGATPVTDTAPGTN